MTPIFRSQRVEFEQRPSKKAKQQQKTAAKIVGKRSFAVRRPTSRCAPIVASGRSTAAAKPRRARSSCMRVNVDFALANDKDFRGGKTAARFALNLYSHFLSQNVAIAAD